MNKLELISSKILSRDKLKRTLSLWNFKNKKIVFTNGCFDILHLGHVEYLAKAAQLGDVLVIGLNSDKSVSQIKGNQRPINNENARAMVLASMQFVTSIVLFDEATPSELIREIQPNILVKGKDYQVEEIVGYDVVKAKGGKVVTIELTPGYSTTGIEEKILHLHKK